jgi:hypothetical protein
MYVSSCALLLATFCKERSLNPNPIYDERKKPKVLSMLLKLVGSAAPIECQKKIKIPKGTIAIIFPSVLHYDDFHVHRRRTFLLHFPTMKTDLLSVL